MRICIDFLCWLTPVTNVHVLTEYFDAYYLYFYYCVSVLHQVVLINFDSLLLKTVCDRSYGSSEVKLPLPSNNPLILSCDAVLSQKANGM